MTRSPALVAPVVLLALLPGCHTGLEVAGVKSATARRAPDGRVTVTATLECALVKGRPRSSGCDADDSTVCLQATWYDETDRSFETPRFQARECAHQDTIKGTKMAVTSAVPIPGQSDVPPPATLFRIRVQTDAKVNGDGRYPEVVIHSP